MEDNLSKAIAQNTNDEQVNHFNEAVEQYKAYKAAHTPYVNTKKYRRNDPCPCGSGKKYKYCCGR